MHSTKNMASRCKHPAASLFSKSNLNIIKIKCSFLAIKSGSWHRIKNKIRQWKCVSPSTTTTTTKKHPFFNSTALQLAWLGCQSGAWMVRMWTETPKWFVFLLCGYLHFVYRFVFFYSHSPLWAGSLKDETDISDLQFFEWKHMKRWIWIWPKIPNNMGFSVSVSSSRLFDIIFVAVSVSNKWICNLFHFFFIHSIVKLM